MIRAACSLSLLLAPAVLLSACGKANEASGSGLTAEIELAALQSGRNPLSEADAKLAADANLLPANTQSLLAQGKMRHGEFAWNEDGVEQGEVNVWVDVERQTVSVFRGGHEIGTALILYGAPGHDTPLGTFPILRKIADYHSRTYDAPMPHSLFLTDDGVALHGSKVRPRRSTHGCIG